MRLFHYPFNFRVVISSTLPVNLYQHIGTEIILLHAVRRAMTAAPLPPRQRVVVTGATGWLATVRVRVVIEAGGEAVLMIAHTQE